MPVGPVASSHCKDEAPAPNQTTEAAPCGAGMVTDGAVPNGTLLYKKKKWKKLQLSAAASAA